uniref:Beta-defensin-like domain-containing protein n=1 Tax=Myotis lucifugus TaxID=59463 RepID=G1QCP2_MYOLU
MERLFWPQALLLVALLFPGLCGTRHVSQGGTEGPRAPRDEAFRPGTNDSHSLHHPGKRYLVPLTPLLAGDIPPGIRNIICMMQHGTCRLFFCHGGERKGEICSDPWNRCCISTAEEER